MSFTEFQLGLLYCNAKNFETAFEKSLAARKNILLH